MKAHEDIPVAPPCTSRFQQRTIVLHQLDTATPLTFQRSRWSTSMSCTRVTLYAIAPNGAIVSSTWGEVHARDGKHRGSVELGARGSQMQTELLDKQEDAKSALLQLMKQALTERVPRDIARERLRHRERQLVEAAAKVTRARESLVAAEAEFDAAQEALNAEKGAEAE